MIEGGGLAFEDAKLKDKENPNKAISSKAQQNQCEVSHFLATTRTYV